MIEPAEIEAAGIELESNVGHVNPHDAFDRRSCFLPALSCRPVEGLQVVCGPISHSPALRQQAKSRSTGKSATRVQLARFSSYNQTQR